MENSIDKFIRSSPKTKEGTYILLGFISGVLISLGVYSTTVDETLWSIIFVIMLIMMQMWALLLLMSAQDKPNLSKIDK